MRCITEETVKRTWQSIGQMPPESTVRAMHQFAEAQPNLVGFVDAYSDEADGGALSTYMSYVIYQMFINAGRPHIPKISEAQIRAQYELTADLLLSVHASGEASSAELADLESANQPWVYRYVTEALLEHGNETHVQYEFDDIDSGEVFMMLKTVIDVVDSATN